MYKIKIFFQQDEEFAGFENEPSIFVNEISEHNFWNHLTCYGIDIVVRNEKHLKYEINGKWYSIVKFNYPCNGHDGLMVLQEYYPGNDVTYVTWDLCIHDYKHTLLGRCWHKYTCTKCSSSFEIDSGD